MAILDFLSSKVGAWSASVWDGLVRAIDARFKPLEEQLDIQRATTDAIVSRGLNVIEDELAPVVAQGQDVLTAINAVKASADDVHDDLVAMRDEGIDTGHILTDATARFTSDAEMGAKATPADITAAIDALKGGASSALDTLNELAAALGDDPDFAGTIIAALGERVRYDAPQAKTASEQAQARTNIIAGHALQGLRSMNALVNPFFAVSQENGRNVLTASVGYGADSTFSSFGSGAFDHGTKAAAFSGMPVPFPFMYETVCTTTGSADYKQIVHTIEADRLVPFGFGTSFAVPSLVACVVEANFTGKVCVTLGNHDGTRSCAIEIDVIADVSIEPIRLLDEDLAARPSPKEDLHLAESGATSRLRGLHVYELAHDVDPVAPRVLLQQLELRRDGVALALLLDARHPRVDHRAIPLW